MGFPKTRLRRLRETPALRRLLAEHRLTNEQLIWPAFVVPGEKVAEAIPSMPGVFHFSADRLAAEAVAAWREGISAMLLFGVPDHKDDRGQEALRRDGVIPTAIRAIKEVVPEMVMITDVCLCAYTTHGHCGVVDTRGRVMNDASLELLSSMALVHAQAGADLVAPSDMMDGRVDAIRRVLDGEGCQHVGIMSYAAKYASSFYGPFRDAAHSSPAFGDRKSYQLNPENSREALREMELDIEEGADIIMVKPALLSLDIIRQARDRFDVPIAAYHVSGEYAMVKAAGSRGWLDEQAALQESLIAIRRAGADIIVTYYAREWAQQCRAALKHSI